MPSPIRVIKALLRTPNNLLRTTRRTSKQKEDRAQFDAEMRDLAENFEDPEAIQLTTYQPRPQCRAAS